MEVLDERLLEEDDEIVAKIEEALKPWIRKNHQLTVLIDMVAKINSTLDIDELLSLIMEAVKEVMDAEASSLMMLDKETKELIIRIPTGPVKSELSGIHVPQGQGFAGWVAENAKPLAVPDVTKDPRHYGKVDKTSGFQTKSLICVPMMDSNSEVIGVLQALNHKDGTSFTDKDIELFTAFADQASLALEKARLHQEELEKQQLEQQLTLANAIQKGFWPKQPEPIEGVSVAAFNIPAKQVGGDYYDFIQINPDKLGMVVGDVSGKGVPAALLMANARSTLRAQVQNGHSVSETVSLVNSTIYQDTPDEKFLTLFYGVFDSNNRSFVYTNGAHNPPFLYNKHTKKEKLLDVGGTLVGIFADFFYEEKSETLEKGDVLVIYTDGVTEASDKDDEMFGVERLHNLIRENAHLDAKSLINLIYEHVVEFTKGMPQFDDITLMALKIEE